MTLPLLSLIIFLPLSGVFFLALIPKHEEKNAKAVGLWISVITFAVSLILWVNFDVFNFEYQFVEKYEWFRGYNIFYHLGIDGISLYFILSTALLVPLCILFSWNNIRKRVREYMMVFLLLETLLLGSFCALDLILFYIFFEGTLIPLFLIIGIWGGEGRIHACFKFFLYTLFGSLFMLLAIVKLYSEFGTTDLTYLIDQKFSFSFEIWLWLAFFLAMAVKIPMWPFHTWLPFAHVEAPTAGSVLLAGVLLKLGAYGFARIVIPLLPAASEYFSPFIMTLSVISIIYASLVALVQQDMKKLIAYSSIAHMGFVTLGLFSLKLQGLSGAVLLMLSHGLISSALFLLVGMIYERFHTREIAAYEGLYQSFPILASLFLFFTFASIAVPGTSSFVGEFYVLYGTFQTDIVFATLSLSGVILGPLYALRLYRNLFTGKLVTPLIESSQALTDSDTSSYDDSHSAKLNTSIIRNRVKEYHVQDKGYSKIVRDLNYLERFILSILLILVLLMGIYPQIFTNVVNRSIRAKVLVTHSLSNIWSKNR
jgi:NADH-quinone oxidoreductase subunit M